MKRPQRALAQRWAALQPRERLGLQLAAGLLGVYLLWTVLLAPALHTLRHAKAQQHQLQAQLLRMQALQARAEQARTAARNQPQGWREELQDAVQSLGAAELRESAHGPQVLLQGCDPQALGRWLAELGPRWRLQVTEASLRRDEQGLWHGQLQLQAP